MLLSKCFSNDNWNFESKKAYLGKSRSKIRAIVAVAAAAATELN